MTTPLDIATEIRRLHFAEKWPVHTVAAQLRVHADVVRRVIGLATASSCAHPRPRVQDLVAPYTEFIAETLARFPRLRATRLFDMMQARGFAGSHRTVRRYLQQVRPTSRGEVCLRPQPLIGEQAQVDWMHIGNVSTGPSTTRALWAFVMVLSYSRALWAELLFDLTAHGVRRSLIRGCVHFGGSPRTWLFDNPKTVVIERHGNAMRFHALILEVASSFCADPRLCAVRHPQSKGRVERAVRFLRDRFCYGRTFISLAQGTAELTDFLAPCVRM